MTEVTLSHRTSQPGSSFLSLFPSPPKKKKKKKKKKKNKKKRKKDQRKSLACYSFTFFFFSFHFLFLCVEDCIRLFYVSLLQTAFSSTAVWVRVCLYIFARILIACFLSRFPTSVSSPSPFFLAIKAAKSPFQPFPFPSPYYFCACFCGASAACPFTFRFIRFHPLTPRPIILSRLNPLLCFCMRFSPLLQLLHFPRLTR